MSVSNLGKKNIYNNKNIKLLTLRIINFFVNLNNLSLIPSESRATTNEVVEIQWRNRLKSNQLKIKNE